MMFRVHDLADEPLEPEVIDVGLFYLLAIL